MSKEPLPSVCTARLYPVSVFTIVTVAPGITAPEASTTVPRIRPVTSARTTAADKNAKTKVSANSLSAVWKRIRPPHKRFNVVHNRRATRTCTHGPLSAHHNTIRENKSPNRYEIECTLYTKNRIFILKSLMHRKCEAFRTVIAMKTTLGSGQSLPKAV